MQAGRSSEHRTWITLTAACVCAVLTCSAAWSQEVMEVPVIRTLRGSQSGAFIRRSPRARGRFQRITVPAIRETKPQEPKVQVPKPQEPRRDHVDEPRQPFTESSSPIKTNEAHAPATGPLSDAPRWTPQVTRPATAPSSNSVSPGGRFTWTPQVTRQPTAPPSPENPVSRMAGSPVMLGGWTPMETPRPSGFAGASRSSGWGVGSNRFSTSTQFESAGSDAPPKTPPIPESVDSSWTELSAAPVTEKAAGAELAPVTESLILAAPESPDEPGREPEPPGRPSPVPMPEPIVNPLPQDQPSKQDVDIQSIPATGSSVPLALDDELVSHEIQQVSNSGSNSGAGALPHGVVGEPQPLPTQMPAASQIAMGSPTKIQLVLPDNFVPQEVEPLNSAGSRINETLMILLLGALPLALIIWIAARSGGKQFPEVIRVEIEANELLSGLGVELKTTSAPAPQVWSSPRTAVVNLADESIPVPWQVGRSFIEQQEEDATLQKQRSEDICRALFEDNLELQKALAVNPGS